MVAAARPSDPEVAAFAPASEPAPSRPLHVASGLAVGLLAHVVFHAVSWDGDEPSLLYGLIGLTQALYMAPLVAAAWRWPRGWRIGLLGAAALALAANATMLHLTLIGW